MGSCYTLAMMQSKIIASGRALPKRLVSNTELARSFKLSEEEIVRKTGVHTRYWAEPEDKPSSLAIEAAKQALASAKLSPGEIDLILVTTTTPDMYFPSTASLVHKGLAVLDDSLGNIPAFDINASCSGFIYALSIADQFLKSASVSTALVIATDLKSRFINPLDASTAILFGDGAGAVILKNGERGIRKITIGADGTKHQLIYLPGGGAMLPTTAESLKADQHYMKMEGKRLFRVAVRTMASALSRFLKASELTFDDIDFFIFHQANLRILEALFKRISIPISKTEITLSQFGNTSSSTIPIALDVAIESGKLKKGDRVLLSAFGGGVTWGNALIDW